MEALPLDDMARVLRALGNRSRLALLHAVRAPKRLSEIEVPSSRDDTWGSAERAVSRQGVQRHLQPLLDIGAVNRQEPDASGDARYVLDHARLYELTEQLRALARIRPTSQDADPTRTASDPTGVRAPDGPYVVTVRGLDEGVIRPLDPKAAAQGWLIGRDRAAEVPLEFDRFASLAHARITRSDEGFALADLTSNRNGTRLNWQPLSRGAVAPLVNGDVVGVGSSLLLFRC